MPKAEAKLSRRAVIAAASLPIVIGPVSAHGANPVFELAARHADLDKRMSAPGTGEALGSELANQQTQVVAQMTLCPTDSREAALAKMRVVSSWYWVPVMVETGHDRVLFDQVLAWLEERR